jgi:Protein of unknown function (DUF4238)
VNNSDFSTLSVGDLKEASSLAARLKAPADGVSGYIRGRLRESTRQDLAQWQGPEEVPPALQQSMVEDLNAIIGGCSIWDADCFRLVKIRQETRDLLERNPSGEDVAWLNRLLLEDAYQGELSRNRDEHFVSQVLLRRHTVSGRLQCYNVQTDNWKPQPPKKVFSEFGYNKLLVAGQVDNTLEDAFQRVETDLGKHKTLEVLEEAANKSSCELPPEVYENMCWYCAFLESISPAAKAAAPVDFVQQLDLDLQNGKIDTLRDVLHWSEERIETFRKGHSLGLKPIIDAKDFLQLVYRIQFQPRCRCNYMMFRGFTDWSVCDSPIELPVSDNALVPLGRDDFIYHILPIGPKLLLKGKAKQGQLQSSSQLSINGEDLTADEAEYWLDTICLSALTEMVCAHRIPDVPLIRERAKEKKIRSVKVVDPDAVISACSKNFDGNFGLRLVSVEEHVKFVHSFTQPGTPISTA